MRRRLSRILLLLTGLFVVAVCTAPPTNNRMVPPSTPRISATAVAQRMIRYETLPTTTTSSTTTTTAPAPREGNLGAQDAQELGDVQQAILDVFGADGPAALRVARCESSFNPTARNGQYVGIFQLGDYHRARAARLGYTWEQVSTEAYPNIVVAHDLFLEQGWGPWQCRP